MHDLPAPEGKGEIGQEDGKGQMDGADLGTVEDPQAEQERQGRSHPELEQGPAQGRPKQ